MPHTQASRSAKKEQIRKPLIHLKEILPSVLVSEICPIANVMEVKTIGTITSCNARMNI